MNSLIIIDTDPGLDDIEAIMMCLKKPNVKILAITLVAGNGSMKQIKQNISAVFKFLEVNHIPVYESYITNSQGEQVESDGYFGNDAMGGLDLENHLVDFPNKMAPQAIVDLILEYKHQITLIGLGPLTNFMLAYKINPQIVSYIKEFIVMGGSEYCDVYNNANEHSEFNVLIDPTAFEFVINAYSTVKPIKLITWNTCLRCPIDQERMRQIYESSKEKEKSKIGQLFQKICSSNKFGPLKKSNDHLYITADPFAIFWLLSPEHILQTKLGFASVRSFDGPQKGQMSINFNNNLDSDGFKPNVEVAIYLNVYEFVETFSDLFH